MIQSNSYYNNQTLESRFISNNFSEKLHPISKINSMKDTFIA